MNQKLLKNLFFIVFLAGLGFTLFKLFTSENDKSSIELAKQEKANKEKKTAQQKHFRLDPQHSQEVPTHLHIAGMP